MDLFLELRDCGVWGQSIFAAVEQLSVGWREGMGYLKMWVGHGSGLLPFFGLCCEAKRYGTVWTMMGRKSDQALWIL